MDSVLVAAVKPLAVPLGDGPGLRARSGGDRPAFEAEGSRVYLNTAGLDTWRSDMELEPSGRKALAEGLSLLGTSTPQASWEVLFSGSLVALHLVLSSWADVDPVVVWDDADRAWLLPDFLEHIVRIDFDHARLLAPVVK